MSDPTNLNKSSPGGFNQPTQQPENSLTPAQSNPSSAASTTPPTAGGTTATPLTQTGGGTQQMVSPGLGGGGGVATTQQLGSSTQMIPSVLGDALALGGGPGGSSSTTINNMLPSQAGNAGRFLSTDGSNPLWATVSGLPAQSGKANQILSTDGTNAFWTPTFVTTINDSNGPFAHTMSFGQVSDHTLMKIAMGDPSPYANFYQNISSNFPLQAFHDDVFKMGWNIGQIIPGRGALTIEMESYFEGSNNQMEFHNAFISPSGQLTRFLTFLGAVDGTEHTSLMLQFGTGVNSQVVIQSQNANSAILSVQLDDIHMQSQTGLRYIDITSNHVAINGPGSIPLTNTIVSFTRSNLEVVNIDENANVNLTGGTNPGIVKDGRVLFFPTPNDGTVAIYNSHFRPSGNGDKDVGILGNSWRTGYFATSVLTAAVDQQAAGTVTIGGATATAVQVGRTGQTLGFFGAVPVVKQSAPTPTLAEVVTALRNYGLLV